MDRKVVLWIVTGCGILCLGMLLFVFILGRSFLKLATQTLEDIEVDIIMPAAVSLDEEFVLLVEITNLADEEQTLDSIDIDASYLDGVIVNDTDPAYVDFTEITNAFHTYEFQTPIPVGSTLNVSFYLTANQVGESFGEISVCINSLVSCISQDIRTIIEE